MSGAWLGGILGQAYSQGVAVELGTGVNFTGSLSAAYNEETGLVDVTASGDTPDSDQVENVSDVAGASVSDALETLDGDVGELLPSAGTDDFKLGYANDGALDYSDNLKLIDDSGTLRGIETVAGVLQLKGATTTDLYAGGVKRISVTNAAGFGAYVYKTGDLNQYLALDHDRARFRSQSDVHIGFDAVAHASSDGSALDFHGHQGAAAHHGGPIRSYTGKPGSGGSVYAGAHEIYCGDTDLMVKALMDAGGKAVSLLGTGEAEDTYLFRGVSFTIYNDDAWTFQRADHTSGAGALTDFRGQDAHTGSAAAGGELRFAGGLGDGAAYDGPVTTYINGTEFTRVGQDAEGVFLGIGTGTRATTGSIRTNDSTYWVASISSNNCFVVGVSGSTPNFGNTDQTNSKLRGKTAVIVEVGGTNTERARFDTDGLQFSNEITTAVIVDVEQAASGAGIPFKLVGQAGNSGAGGPVQLVGGAGDGAANGPVDVYENTTLIGSFATDSGTPTLWIGNPSVAAKIEMPEVATGHGNNLLIIAQAGASGGANNGGDFIGRGGADGGSTPGGAKLQDGSGNTGVHVGYSGSAVALSFFGASLANKITISGSKGGNAALASLCAALDTYGILTDNTS